MTSPPLDLNRLQQWAATTEIAHDTVRPDAVAALAATLDCPRAPAAGQALPPLWHWINFWGVAPQAQLGADGHPKRGGFLPPVSLPRRMWAGGRLVFHAGIPVGATLTRRSDVQTVADRPGASGHLAFVTVRHAITHDERPVIDEEHDIVYRSLPADDGLPPAPKPAPADALWSATITPDPVLLFRYSALTFNGHRIHYDRAYATEIEGYPGLVVHGPLIATLLLELLRRRLPAARVAEFRFRAVAPLFDGAPVTLCGRPEADGRGVRLWAQNGRAELAMQAEALLAGPGQP